MIDRRVNNFFHNDKNWFNEIKLDKIFEVGPNSVGKYPPSNLIETSPGQFRIEIAVAGFKKDELKIVHTPELLTVSGRQSDEQSNKNYIHKGISTKDFEISFAISPAAKLDAATFIDGILAINVYVEKSSTKKGVEIEIK